MKKIVNICVTALSILIFILSIYIIIGSTLAVRNNELFRLFGYSYAVVPTKSMEGDNPDSLDAGDAVIIFNTPYEDLNIGDVIVYISNEDGKMIIHRIIDKTEEGFITKGDNNNDADIQIVTKDAYQGKYTGKFQFFKIGLWLTDFRIILIGGVSVVLFIAVIYQIFKIIWDYKKAKLLSNLEDKNSNDGEQDNEGKGSN